MAIPLFLPGESHGQRCLGGYSPQNGKELDTTEATQHTHTILILPNQYTLNIVVIPFQSFSVWIFNSYNHNQKLQFCFFTKYYVKESSEFLYNLFLKNLFIQLSQVFAEALGISVKSCGSFVAVHRLSGCGARGSGVQGLLVVAHGLSNFGMQAQLPLRSFSSLTRD